MISSVCGTLNVFTLLRTCYFYIFFPCLFFLLFLYTSCMLSVADRQVVSFVGQRSYIPKIDYYYIDWPIERPEDFNIDTTILFEITKTFNAGRIAQCVFGDDTNNCDQTIIVSGSHTSDRLKSRIFAKKHFKECRPCHKDSHKRERQSLDWLADYFGLPPDFKSVLHFIPQVNEYITTAYFRMRLDPLCDGLYFSWYAPLIYTKWDLNFEERVEQEGTLPFDAGYFAPQAIARDHLCSNFTSFVEGCCVPQDDTVIFHPLLFSKMSTHGLRTIRLADFTVTLGSDFKRTECYRLGGALFASAPTGTRPDAVYLFQPIAGNGHHWVAGGRFYGTLHFLGNQDDSAYCTLHGDIALSHIFDSKQRRTMDIIDKPNSRYMIVEKLTKPIDDGLQGDTFTPTQQFKNEFAPLANISTLDVNVAIGAQVNINAFLAYTCDHSAYMLGYRFWKRRCSNITFSNPNQFPEDTWALKGDAYMYGFIGEEGALPIGTPVALSATQHRATIAFGKNLPIHGTDDPEVFRQAKRNVFIDHARLAYAGSHQRLVASLDDLSLVNQTHTSVQPRTLTIRDLDIEGSRSYGEVNTFFASAHHTWHHACGMDMALGIGADIDFGRGEEVTASVTIDECLNTAFSAWKVYAHFSVNFY